MSARIQRTVQIAMSNYSEITGACVFSVEGKTGYMTENLQLKKNDFELLVKAWNGELNQFVVKNIPFITVLNSKSSLVAINPSGATSMIMATGKGVWFMIVFAPTDADKSGILRECIQAAKNLETSVSIYDI
jgi:hypothetical protein